MQTSLKSQAGEPLAAGGGRRGFPSRKRQRLVGPRVLNTIRPDCWDIRLIGKSGPTCQPQPTVRDESVSSDVRMLSNPEPIKEAEAPGARENGAVRRIIRAPERIFYRYVLPLGVLANLGLGILLLAGLRPESWYGWLEAATAAFCCVVAGWLAAAAWSKSYWNRSMARQVATWRQISDAFFGWLEEAPLPAESLQGLKASLENVVPNSERN